jgi:hypothetical protein
MRVSSLSPALLGMLLSAPLGCGARENPDNAAWETRPGFRMLGVAGEEIDVTASKTLYGGFDWVGVRHDLSVNPASTTSTTCSCLRVEHGDPGESSRFVWRGPRPDLNPVNQAIAISALGIECPGGATNEADRRPSIRGVERVGNDTVVEIEELPPDRPIATGAIIRPLDPAGHLYIRPRSKNLPYAKLSGRQLCRIK